MRRREEAPVQKTPVLLNLVFSIAACLLATPALAGVTPAVDAYVCHKAKDLKIPGTIFTSPDPTSTMTYVGANNCELGKMTSICLPATVFLSTVNNSTVAQCCFKAKCTVQAPPVPLFVIGIFNLQPSFDGQVETSKKVSTVCMPCDYSAP